MGHLLTNPQNSIWLTEKFFKGTSVNNICGYVYIKDEVNFDVLKKSINQLVKTNDSMRFKFKEENGSCVQYENNYEEFDIEMFNFSSEEDIEKKALEMANVPFDFENSFLFKFILFKLPNNSGGFIVNVHHIIGDSWTLGLIAKEVTGIYSSLLNNTYEEKQFPSYINYINNENEYINSEKYIKDKAYWDEVFKTVPEVASIPSMKDNKNIAHSCKGAREKFIVPEKEISKIKEFCTNNKISVYNFFMAIYSLYIGRVSNLDDFVVGTPILNRTNFEQKHTMGMFISTAPLRINLDHELSFIDFSKNIASNSMSLLRHQRYPYQAILEDLRKKDANIPNLYNVVLSYQITKTVEEENNIKYTTDWVFNGNCADELQIHLFDLHGEDSITVAYDYKSEKYDSQDIKDLHSRILTVVNQVIDNNEILLKNIEIVTPEEKHKILYEFNDTAVDYPRDKTIVDLFEEQVKKTPDNIAVVFENQKLTYRELNQKANQLANYLVDNNIKVGDIVAILLDKSLEVIVSMFAILKCGASFLPLDIDYPEERLEYILNSSNPKLILSSKNIDKKINNFNILNIDLDNTEIYNNNISNLNIKLTPENIMYVMYTSGSTGKPKGVMVKHKNIIRLAMYPNFIEFSENEVMIQTGTIVFDACIFEIFGSLLHGFKLHIIKKEKLLDIEYFSKFLKEKQVSILFLTTGLFNHLGIQNPNMFKNLKYLLTGGDVISTLSVNNILKNTNNLKIINCYGPTENGSYSTCYEITGNEENIPIGKPITNSSAFVVNHNGNLCPIGIPGELWVSGKGVAKGYLKNEALTNESFIKNPFGNDIVYKTGDLVRWLPDGNIEFIGRIDNQVKIRGFRIELSEIDTNILKFPDIKQAVSVVQNINNTKTICSYIISNEHIDINKLKTYLSKTLASYMLPTYIIQLDNLPLNINGKVDRKLLPLPSTNETEKNIVKPRNNIDKTILTILKNILSTETISIEDNLFNIGLDSLSAITLSSNITKELCVQITVQDIFEYPTIKELSDFICTLSQTRSINTIEKAEQMDCYPLSSAQKRIYYASSMDNNSTLYNISGGIILNKNLDINKLEQCFNVLINRHEVLRTSFKIKNNDIVQIINNNIDFKLELDSSNNTKDAYCDFVKPFDLSKAPLFRAKVIKLEDEKMLLLIDMHHIISDGTSLSILMQELCNLYNDNELVEKQIDYTDFTLWEKEQFESDEFKSSKEYWVNQFKDEIPLLNMPTTYARPSAQNFEGSNYYAKLSQETFDKIENISKALGITPYMLMLSCYYILLSKYTSQDDIVVGTPIVGRESPELSNVLGMFVNTLAMRNKIDISLSFNDFANKIKENCLDAFKNQSYPFDMLVKDLDIKRDISRNPLFDIMFVYQNNGYPEINFKDTKTEYFILDNNVSKFDLSLEVIPTNNQYSLRFEYCTKLFDEDFIKRLSSHYINILNAILDNYEIKIADIDMLSEEEKNQILYEFNNTKVDYPTDINLLDLFNAIVKTTPNNIAVSDGIFEITYHELNLKANYLAGKLYAKGVSCGDVVGVCLNRSIELLVSIWAILKLGATYMPMYVGYPIDRLNYMLSDSDAKVLITNSSINSLFDKTNKIIIDDLSEIDNLNNFNVETYISSTNNAYVIYTSGSTGKPKGVKISHKNLINFIYNFNNYYNKIDTTDVFFASTNISFDVSIWELFMPILNGAKLVLNTEEILSNIIEYSRAIIEKQVTALYIPPNILNEVFELLKNNPDVKISKLLVGVEGIKKETLNKYFELNNDMVIVNGYGPTETTICATALVYKKDLNNVNSFVSIGRPLSNNIIYILNESLQHQPIGIPGEIYISGYGVGNGYINNSDANKHSFIKFNDKILYKSGDLAKWNEDGTINFIGRADNQIKFNGYRIELNEINSIILSYPNITKCNTIVSKNGNTSYLASYFTSDTSVTTKDLKAYLQTKLAFYMIPKFLIQIDSFPMTVNGKIDYKSLPVPDYESNTPYVAPRNNFEQKISKIWCNLLRIRQISIDDNFFDIGCDSLVAIKFQLEALKENIDINYSDIFRYPTIRLLSENKNVVSDTSYGFNIDYDYTNINNILIKNNNANNYSSRKNTLKNNVLLLGSTGFLGAHLLDSYLSNNPDKAIYCIVRRKSFMNPSDRLKKTLNYYFGEKYDNYFLENKIIVIEGDTCQKSFGLSLDELNNLMNNVDIIINSAALVKHYGDYETFSKINIESTKLIIDICKNYNKKFYHISTLSVSGLGLPNSEQEKETSEKSIFDETCLYINQKLDNIYLYTKFEAEKCILNEINNGLNATVLRIGNLTNRFSDGIFQINLSENGFVNKIKSIINLGVIPHSFLEHAIELTPVDLCANAIIKIINADHEFSVLHIFNNNFVMCKHLLEYINKFVCPIETVSKKIFSLRITDYLNSDNLKDSIAGIVTDLNKDKSLNYVSNIILKSDISNNFLHFLGFHWPELDEFYFEKYFDFFTKINYFTQNKED